jgi:hypothetical protein
MEKREVQTLPANQFKQNNTSYLTLAILGLNLARLSKSVKLNFIAFERHH